jgi:hypothetical protein
VAGAEGRGAVLATAVAVAATAVRVCRGASKAAVGAEAGVALLLAPLKAVIEGLAGEAKGGLQEAVAELRGEVEASAAAGRGSAALRLHARAAVPIKQVNPRFDEGFNPDYDMDVDRERAEKRKLKRRHRSELKGAVRELRKDNAFLADDKAQQLKAQREARDQRGKAIETFLSQQQFQAKLGAGKKNSKGRKRK